MENQEETANIIMPPSALSIFDANQVTVLKIETDGKMFWRPQGSTELVELDIEKDLSTAFALCVEMLSGLPHKTLMEQTRSEAVKSKAQSIAEAVTQYLMDIKLTTEEHKAIHIKNVTTIVNGI